MASALAKGNHNITCKECGQFVAKERTERSNLLMRVHCPYCGWSVCYKD